MNVDINFKSTTNEHKWASIKSGEFLVLEGTDEHPILPGLYRAFLIIEPEPPHHKTITLIPLFEGNFGENQYPYILSNGPNFPRIIHKVNKITIEAEIFQ